ncbi:helix-turn-helix domain-containing protein [Marinifilum sp. N1E240]|uniref:ArsR/SmtB family transcription factor n=1 Tax=Marinifilum sp. N1E240 TaxID=2608082 RepID=UPI00128BE9BF|nr:metalloregulator ArsR/SmtB family transcription factor [Marinifilum sp. N1E240]MPQ47276.1 helix-turn-helix domain-containing protein [Marinifilum sp. N1E240]
MEEVKEFYSVDEKQMARFAKALSHPVRVYICDILSKQSCCYSGDLAAEVPIARSTLSQHLKELKNSGLIQGEINPPKIKYCLNKENWAQAQQLFNNFFKQK